MVGTQERLEADTRQLRRFAERHVRILDGDATTADYRDYLRAMYGFHAPLEEIFAADSVLDGRAARSRRKAPLLLQDLRALGDHTPPAWCTSLPDASTLAQRLGIAYVLEGSLGGRYILERLSPALRELPCAFLAASGQRRFGGLVERLLVTREAADEAISAACETFVRMIEWLGTFSRRNAA
jgi:heme oxygenase